MNAKHYSIDKFLDKIKDKNLDEIIIETEREIRRIENCSFEVKGSVMNRENGSLEYLEKLKKFAFFMNNGIKPIGIEKSLFQSFKIICQNLIEKKQLKSEVLKIF